MQPIWHLHERILLNLTSCFAMESAKLTSSTDSVARFARICTLMALSISVRM